MIQKLQLIRKYQCLSDKDIEEALPCFSSQDYKKNQAVVQFGSYCDKLFFITSGLVYSISENETINWYETEGRGFTDLNSYLTGERSQNQIICVEDSELLIISRKDLLHLTKKNHNWSLWYNAFLEDIYLKISVYFRNLRITDASERYYDLLTKHPDIATKVPLKHIASYLGISQVSLSRIRAGKQKKS